jgi:hypothetical protein
VKIILDSNVWRYVVDAGGVPALKKAARKSRHCIAVPPAVLYEAAHTQDKVLRDALLAAIAAPAWKRLMPEAYSEAEEVKGEIRRLRNEWLRPRPNLERFKRIRHDWVRSRGGIWDLIRKEAVSLQRHDAEMGQRTRDQAYRLREDARSLPPKWRTATLTKTVGVLSSPQPGWDGRPVEMWRFDGLNVFSMAVRTPGNPTFDWIADEVDIDLMLLQSASHTRFWLHDVDLKQMRRHWLRWAFGFLQRLHRVTDGTPADAQLGTYLVEADLMLTADRVLVNIAERCRKDAPFGMAESRLVPASGEAVATVLAVLKES